MNRPYYDEPLTKSECAVRVWIALKAFVIAAVAVLIVAEIWVSLAVTR